MKIRDIITISPHCISPDASLVEAAAKMKTFDIGWLPVCENDRLMGTVTDRDITIRSVAEGYDPNNIAVRQIMSRLIIHCFDDQDIQDAAQIMGTHKIRRLPVLNRDEHLVGIVSLGDLALRTGLENLAGRILERVSEPTWQIA